MDTRALVTRRRIISSALGTGLALMGTPAVAFAAANDWKPSDGLRLAGSYQGIVSLDPVFARDLDTIFIVRQICRGLVGYDESLSPVPDIAASIDVSDDGLVYIFAVRDDAVFHDGSPIEAEDVRFSLTRAIDPATAGGDVSQLPGPIYLRDIDGADALMTGEADSLGGIAVVDSRTIAITLSAPSSTFLMKLAATPAAILDRHQDMTEPDWWTSLNGSGPYRIEAFEAETGMKLRAVDLWRGSEISVQDVDILIGIGAAQPVNLFQAGEIDLVTEVPPALVSLVSDPSTGMDDAILLEKDDFALSYIAMGNRRAPLDDVHIRRALQYAFPVDRYAEAAFDGRVRDAEGVIPPGMLGQEWLAMLPPVDADAARAEIAASRYGEGAAVPPLRIYAADIAPVEALRDVARDQLGLVIEAVQVNWFDFMQGLSSRQWDAYTLFWGVDYPDPEALLAVLFASDSPENYTGYANPAFDDLLADARRETDISARRRIYAEAQQILIDDAAVIPLYIPIRYTLARAGMSHVPITPMGLLGLEELS